MFIIPGLSSSPVQPHPAPIFEMEVVWLKLVGAAHQLEPYHLLLFFLGGEWHLLISEQELQSPGSDRRYAGKTLPVMLQ